MNDLINASHQLFYVVVAIAGVAVLIVGVVRGVHHHWKKGHGKALATLGGAILVFVIIAHAVGLANWGSQKFEELPSVGHSNGIGHRW